MIHGNNRCSLAGTDLNRRYLDADPYLHPTIHAVKHLVLSLQESRGVFLYIDLHGHSRKKNSFLYGCDIHLQSDKYMARIPKMSKEEYDARRVYPRIFPKLLCSMSNALKPGRERSGVGALPRDREEGYFSWKDCCFMVQKSKAGTGRVVMWRKCLVESAYTIELSYCGNGNNNEAGLIKKYASLPVLASISNQVMASQLNPNSVSNVKSKTDDNAMEGNAPSASEQHLSYAAVVEDLTKIFASHYLIPNNTKSECRNSRKVQDQDNSTSKTFSKYHYSIADYHNIGLDIGIAMFQFANLTEANVASACENKPSVSANALGKRVSSNVGQTSGNNSLGSNVDDADKCSNARYTSAADIPTLRESHLVYLEHTSGSDRKKLFAQNDVDKDGPIAEETTQESNSNANTASSTISATKSKTRKMKKKKKIKKKSTLGEEEAPISVVELVGSRALDAPLTTATVFTGDAFRFATSKMNSNKCEDDKTKFPREHIEAVLWKLSSRLQVEWKVRKALQIQFPEENGCVSSAFQVSEDEQEDCGDGDGSDSDPSVDNLPVQRVLQRSKNNFERLNEKSNRNSETMLSYIKKKLMKSRKNDKKSSTEKPLKSSTGQNSATASKEGIARLGGPNTVNPPTSNVVPRSTLAIKANPKPNFSSVKFEQEVVNTNCIADKPPLFLHVRNISLDVLDSFVEIPEPPTGAVAGAPSPTGISKKSVSATDSNSAQTSTSSSTASQFYRGHAISTNSARTRRDSTVTPASLRNSLASSMAVLPDHSNSSKDSVDNQPRPSRPSSAGGLSERLGGTCNRKRNTDTNSVTSTTGLSMVSTTSSGSVLMSNNRYVQLKDTNRSAMSTASHDNEKDTKLYVTTHVLSKQHVQSNSHTILRPTLGAQSAENSKTASVINNLIDPNSCSRTARASRGSSSTTSYNKLPPTWSPSTGSSIRKSIPLNSNKQSSTSTPRESRIGSSRASSTSPAPTSSAVDDKDTNNKSFGAIYGALGNKFKRSELFLDSETQFEEEVVVHSSKQHTLLTSMLVDKDNIDSGLSNNAILPVLRTGHSKDKPKVLI